MTKGKNVRSTWKDLEKRIAHFFGVERNSNREMGKDAPDIIALVKLNEAAIFDIEVKLTSSPPGYMEKIMAQAEKNCKGGSHIPMAIVKAKHMPDDSAFVFMRFRDFKRICNVEGVSDEKS